MVRALNSSKAAWPVQVRTSLFVAFPGLPLAGGGYSRNMADPRGPEENNESERNHDGGV